MVDYKVKITQPLMGSSKAVLERNLYETLSSLERAISNHENLESINQICEDTEKALNAYRNYEPINTQERREQAKLISESSSQFEKLLENATNANQAGKKHADFEDLNEDLYKQRAEHVKILEEKMKVVGEIMKDAAEMTKEQGNAMDRIDLEVGKAKKNTEKGVEELEKTSRRQRCKKSICVTTLIVVAIVLVIIVLVAVIMPNENPSSITTSGFFYKNPSLKIKELMII